MRKRNGFTLVELLVVVGVVTLLIAILLPALSKAREYAMRITCASNVRQLAMATIMYANENKDVLPSQQGLNYLTQGDFNTYGPNDSFAGFVNTQMNVSSVYSPTTGTPEGDTRKNLALRPPRVMICPSAEVKPNYFRLTYAMWAGSLFPTAVSVTDLKYHPYRMKLTTLIQAGLAAKLPGDIPALWADRVQIANQGNNGGPGETCHWDNSGQPSGGNVARADGSVIWMPYLGLAYNVGNPTDTFVIPSFGANEVPANCLYIYADSLQNINQTGGGQINKVCAGGRVLSLAGVFTDAR